MERHEEEEEEKEKKRRRKTLGNEKCIIDFLLLVLCRTFHGEKRLEKKMALTWNDRLVDDSWP